MHYVLRNDNQIEEMYISNENGAYWKDRGLGVCGPIDLEFNNMMPWPDYMVQIFDDCMQGKVPLSEAEKLCKEHHIEFNKLPTIRSKTHFRMGLRLNMDCQEKLNRQFGKNKFRLVDALESGALDERVAICLIRKDSDDKPYIVNIKGETVTDPEEASSEDKSQSILDEIFGAATKYM